MSAETQNEMDRLRKERDEAFARGKQVFEDLRRVEAERDEYRDLADKWRDDWTAAMEQRDALAVHVERFNRIAQQVLDGLDFASRYSHGHAPTSMSAVSREFSRLHSLLQETPATSLARRDALMKAEALEEEANEWSADKYTECCHVRESILGSAAQLRQQAEAGES